MINAQIKDKRCKRQRSRRIQQQTLTNRYADVDVMLCLTYLTTSTARPVKQSGSFRAAVQAASSLGTLQL